MCVPISETAGVRHQLRPCRNIPAGLIAEDVGLLIPMLLLVEDSSLLCTDTGPWCRDILATLPTSAGPLNLVFQGCHPPASLAQWKAACPLGRSVGKRAALARPVRWHSRTKGTLASKSRAASAPFNGLELR